MTLSDAHARREIPPTRVAVWCSSDQATLVQRVLANPRLVLAGVCGIDGTQTAALASALAAPPIGDPRWLARTPEADVIWLAADADLHDDAIRAASALAPLVFSSLPTASNSLRRARWRPAPSTRSMLTSGHALLSELGAVHGAALELGVDPLAGGLGAALLDLADLACLLLEQPEAVAATFVDGDGRVARPTSLRRLVGTAGVLVRGAGGRGLSATLTTAAPPLRRLTVLGDGGRLLLDEQSLRWIDRAGREVDRVEVGLAESTSRIAAEIAAALHKACDGAAGHHTPWDAEATALRFSVVEAARLSGMTGASESVSTLLAAFSAAGA